MAIIAINVFASCNTAHKDTLAAKEFVLTDDIGHVLAKLSHKETETCLELDGREKMTTAMLCVGDDYGADLLLANHAGSNRVSLSAGSRIVEGGGGTLDPGLVIDRSDGNNLISATLGPDARVVMGHASGKNSVTLSGSGDRPSITISDTSGKVVWAIPAK
jgi:hypothetical protein